MAAHDSAGPIAPSMELYHNDMAICAQKVRLVVSEKDLTPVLHHLDLRAGESHTPEYLKLNPRGVVPTLVDHGIPISESTVICEYLDDAYPDTPLRPRDPIARAAMRRWTMLPDTGLHSAASTASVAIAFRHQENVRQVSMFGGQARERAHALLMHGLDAAFVSDQIVFYDRVIGDLARQLDQTPWLAGAAYSLADIAMVPYVCRLCDLEQSWWWEDIPTRSSISPWLARCKSKKGYSGISTFLNPAYLELMSITGTQATSQIKAILDQSKSTR
jgi:glutathione S-transferase